MKNFLLSLISFALIFSSCSNNADDIISSDNVDVKIAYNISTNNSSNNVYQGIMKSRASNHIEEGDSVWNHVFKLAIEDGTLVYNTAKLTFTNLADNTSVTISLNQSKTVSLKQGKYKVSGTAGPSDKDGNYHCSAYANLNVNDTVEISKDIHTIILNATVANSLILSKESFTLYYGKDGDTSYSYDGTSKTYNGYSYAFINNKCIWRFDFKKSSYSYKNQLIDGYFYYYSANGNDISYNTNMSNGFN